MASWLQPLYKIVCMQTDKQSEDMRNAQQGTGSAENLGESRDEQKNQTSDLSEREKRDIAGEAGVGRKHIADLRELGANSGRDDNAG